jgi:hypothetical protein
MFATLGSTGATLAALDEAVKILAVVSDPDQARKALDEIKAALGELQSKQTAIVAAETANTKQLAALVESQGKQNARSQALDEREVTLGRRQTETDVAAAALQEREASVKSRELAADERETMLAAREKALEGRIANYRAALSA